MEHLTSITNFATHVLLACKRCFLPLFCLSLFSCQIKQTEKPDESRFIVEVLADSLDEPMGMTFLPGDKVLFVERKGALKVYDPVFKRIKTVAILPVNTGIDYGGGYIQPIEEGLMGVIAHPDFKKNHWIFLYSADTAASRHLLTRWELKDDRLVEGTEKRVLEVPINREMFKCSGGSMAFDDQGNLYLAVGTNTHYVAPDTLFTPAGQIIVNTNEPETAGNTKDLRGKILRIHPNDDGTYSIPPGNLFSENDSTARPEIYVMGTRNPWRVSIDSKTGNLHWADPGRDDDKEDVAKNNGKGMDEFNVAPSPGNYGWPFFVGDNRPYYSPAGPLQKSVTPDSVYNSSLRNTGRHLLPPSRASVIHYKYSVSDPFPLLGGGGRSAVGGPVFRRADFINATRQFPSYYEGKWFVTDFIRGWIMAVTVGSDGAYKSMEPFLPGENFSSVLDMQFSLEGDLYLLQYGTGWFEHNSNARLVKITYRSGNRPPLAKAVARKLIGGVPFSLQLSGKQSSDPDGDGLTHNWEITGKNFRKEYAGADPQMVIERAGVYKARLTVSDPSGLSSVDELEILAGNEQPAVGIRLLNTNTTFYFPGDTLRYAIDVTDVEDGSIANGSIPISSVQRSIDLFSASYTELSKMFPLDSEQRESLLTPGGILINKMDCRSCHMPDRSSAGPDYASISRRYRNKPEAILSLAQKIIQGGSGSWGTQAMSAHPQLSVREAEQMVEHILSQYADETKSRIPLKGEYILPSQAYKGCVVLQAAYQDKGFSGAAAVRGYGASILRSPMIDPEEADIRKGMRVVVTPNREILMEGDGSYAGFRSIDLNGISKIEMTVIADKWRDMAGGLVECRLDSVSGTLIGKSTVMKATEEGGPHEIVFSFQGDSYAGVHDVYFVFINRGVSPKKLLMEVSAIQFQK